MADVKDILGVPRHAPANAQTEAPKAKERMQRPAGMSREAFALLDGSHPVPPSHLTGDLSKKSALLGLKQKRKLSAKGLTTYQFRPFTNPARKDGLQLKHWVKCFKDTAGKLKEADEQYAFAKFNKQMTILRYNDDEWEQILVKDPAWSRQETDYLLELCEQFDLRFLIIADRYAFTQFPKGVNRSMEDIKARYYAVARQLLVGREGTEDSVANNVLVKHPFNLTHERERKRGLELTVKRTPQQEAEENTILEQAAQIQAARKAEQVQAQRKAPPAPTPQAGPAASTPAAALAAPAAAIPEAAAPSDIPDQAPTGHSSLFTADVAPAKLKPGVYARGRHTAEVAQTQLGKVTGGARAQKLVDTTMAELGVSAGPAVPTRATCGAYLALRAEVISMLEMRKTLQHRQAGEGGADRGRRAAKGKAPARYDSNVDDTPAAKRPRISKKGLED